MTVAKELVKVSSYSLFFSFFLTYLLSTRQHLRLPLNMMFFRNVLVSLLFLSQNSLALASQNYMTYYGSFTPFFVVTNQGLIYVQQREPASVEMAFCYCLHG